MLRSVLPDVRSSADLAALRADPAAWRGEVSALAALLGLPGHDLRDLGGGNLVVGVGGTHVLKLAPPAFAAELGAEAAALRHVEGRLPIPTPRLAASGEHAGWRYALLQRIPGDVLDGAWASTPRPLQLSILRELGEFLAALHALPPPPGPDGWADFVHREARACRERQLRWGVPPEILEGLDDCLARADLTAAGPRPLLHADLHGGNVVVAGEHPAGVIDFGDALRGDPVYDLVTPALLLARGDRELLGALLDASGLSGAPRLRDRFLACAVLHRFNDLTRYLPWCPRPPRSLDELAPALFPV